MFLITVPHSRLFEYQLWLNQNYMIPLVDYMMYPVGIMEFNISFTKEFDLNRFIERWEHTLE